MIRLIRLKETKFLILNVLHHWKILLIKVEKLRILTTLSAWLET